MGIPYLDVFGMMFTMTPQSSFSWDGFHGGGIPHSPLFDQTKAGHPLLGTIGCGFPGNLCSVVGLTEAQKWQERSWKPKNLAPQDPRRW